MCNDYEREIRWAEYCALMQAVELGIPTEQSELDLPAAASTRITDIAPVMRTRGNVVALSPMRWSWPTPGSGKPVFNFRSDNRTFRREERVLIPASAFFEYVGQRSPKAKFRFTLKDNPILAIAGIWKAAAENRPEAFTMLTTEPGPDIAPYHDRQVVVLPPGRWADWLYGDRPEAELCRPLPAGTLAVEEVRRGR